MSFLILYCIILRSSKVVGMKLLVEIGTEPVRFRRDTNNIGKALCILMCPNCPQHIISGRPMIKTDKDLYKN